MIIRSDGPQNSSNRPISIKKSIHADEPAMLGSPHS